MLIGADGIHSYVRDMLYPNEGPARWNGSMLWRGALDWPKFLTGRSMVIAGGMAAKCVIYPIGEGARDDRPLTNWAVLVKVGEGGAPPNKEDWSRPGRFEDLMPHVQRFRIPYVDAKALIEATPEFWEYPMCDRDPLPRWSHGRVTLLGDAAHPMYPVGSNGASQAILDARCLADRLVSAEHPLHALWAYEQERLPPTAQIVRMNRSGGPEGVIDAVEAARAGRLRQHRGRAVVRAAQGDRARLCRRRRALRRARSTGRPARRRDVRGSDVTRYDAEGAVAPSGETAAACSGGLSCLRQCHTGVAMAADAARGGNCERGDHDPGHDVDEIVPADDRCCGQHHGVGD